MSERLRQIWSGFEGQTTRNLTGRGVDKIVVPQRSDWRADDEAFLPEAFEGPAKAAFDVLTHNRKAQKKRFFGRKKKDASPVEPPAAAAPVSDFAGVRDLLMGLRSTAERTERGDMDYQLFLDLDGGKSLNSLKKKPKRFKFF